MKGCSIKGCEQEAKAVNLCPAHRGRIYRHGDPNVQLRNRGIGKTPELRFWSRVAITADDNRCWEWQAGTTKFGYGEVAVNKVRFLAHRYAWFLTHGVIPNLFILHSCDNPKCVNPKHLREGTDQDNSDDKVSRDRQPKGEKHWHSKLTAEKVRTIKTLLNSKTNNELAEQFNVSFATIADIRTGRTWRHETSVSQSQQYIKARMR